MHQVRWLALVGLSLIFFFLLLVHFTLLGTLLIRFYHRRVITHSKYTSMHDSHTFSTQYHTIQEYHKQTSLENRTSLYGPLINN
jgi:hypothetical protein